MKIMTSPNTIKSQRMSSPSRIKTKKSPKKTNADPGSGWKTIKITGIKISSETLKRYFALRISVWIPLKKSATIRDVVIFTNSAGCKLNPPIVYQDVAPEIFCPKTKSPRRLKMENM